MVVTVGCTTTTGNVSPTATQNNTTVTTSVTTTIEPPDDPEEEVIFTAIEIFKSYLEFGHFDRIANFYLDSNAVVLDDEEKELVMERWINTYGDNYEDYSIVNFYMSPPEEQVVSNFLSSQGVLLYYDMFVTFFQKHGDGDDVVYTTHWENLDILFKDGRWWLLLTFSL